MSSKPPAKKRRRVSEPEQSSSVVSAGADISALVAALVPAVTKGVVDTLTSMGVIPQGKEQPEATSKGSSTCTQNTSDILTLTDNNQGEDLQTLVDLQGKEPSNPSISRPLGLGIDNKVKAKIWANEAIDFGSLLGFKKGRKKFEINEELDGACSMTAAKQPFTIRTVNQWMQAFHIFVAIYTEKHPQDAPKLMKYADIVQRLGRQAGDEAALYYDTNFREWRETSPHDN